MAITVSDRVQTPRQKQMAAYYRKRREIKLAAIAEQKERMKQAARIPCDGLQEDAFRLAIECTDKEVAKRMFMDYLNRIHLTVVDFARLTGRRQNTVNVWGLHCMVPTVAWHELRILEVLVSNAPEAFLGLCALAGCRKPAIHAEKFARSPRPVDIEAQIAREQHEERVRANAAIKEKIEELENAPEPEPESLSPWVARLLK